MQLTAPNMVSLMRLWNFLTRYLKIESSFRRRVDGYYLSSGCHYTMLSFTQRSAMLMRRSLSRHSSMITGNSFLKSYLYPLLNALLTDHHEISDHFLLA
ncbi:uncharacterized protein [Rutidosis leptorrhynchoides]|uniref:uncharacterized protein isoform X3 n=1 Tax=Rutidosis leptorrhynchoides TaxID=125765 RepID=UPI003A9A278D